MNDYGWVICAAMAVVGLALLLREHARQSHQLQDMHKMRGSRLYEEIYAIVEAVRRSDLDEVRIERDRVSFFSIYPPGKIADFDLQKAGFPPLNNERAYALAQVLAMDIPQLQSSRNYEFRRYKEMRPNGSANEIYIFTAKKAYKAEVMAHRTRMNYNRLY